jgi:hypothetical protein
MRPRATLASFRRPAVLAVLTLAATFVWLPFAPVSQAHAQLIWVYTEIDGIPRRLEVSFDDVTGLARARTLAVHTMQIVHDPSSEPLPACGSKPDAESRRRWEDDRRRYALKPSDTVVELSAESRENGAVDVIIGGTSGLGLRFTDASGTDPSNSACYAEWVVVG